MLKDRTVTTHAQSSGATRNWLAACPGAPQAPNCRAAANIPTSQPNNQAEIWLFPDRLEIKAARLSQEHSQRRRTLNAPSASRLVTLHLEQFGQLKRDVENWKGRELSPQSVLGAQVDAEEQHHCSDSTPLTLSLLHFLIIPTENKTVIWVKIYFTYRPLQLNY